MKKLFTLFFAVVASIGTSLASTINIGYLWYKLDDNTHTAEVTSYADKNFYGSVVIPDSITYNSTRYIVTKIGNSAFENSKSLASVTIPNSVTSIGNSAFKDCKGFASITIPNSVTEIGTSAFQYCTDLKSITISNNITSIENSTFYGCSKLASITIPNNVTSIGSSAFENCSGLKSITIPNSITSIGSNAFQLCAITSVHISDLTAWCAIDFQNSSANPLHKDLYLNDELVTDLIIPNDVTSIGSYAFYGCTGLVSVTIPNSVATIGDVAFMDCSGLTSIELPNSVTSIGDGAFWDCTGLVSVTIPNSVTKIERRTFYGCQSLTSISIPNSVTTVGEYAFFKCSGLKSIIIPNSVDSIGQYAFYNCSRLDTVYISDIAAWCAIDFQNSDANPLYHANNLYLNNDLLNDLIIPNGVESIRDYTFYNCKSLTSISIPNTVTSIGSSAFSGCSSLTTVTLPNTVTSIGNGAFSGCSSLTSITIPNSVTEIGGGAFSGIINVVYHGSATGSPWGAKTLNGYVDGYLIYDESKTNLVYCSKDAQGSISILNGVTNIESDAFKNCSGLTSIFIPNSVTEIGSSAFYGCSSLTSITIPNSVTSIGSGAFSSCSSLPIENNIRYADTYLIGAVDKTLSSYTIKANIRWIGSSAFSGCKNLTSISIPNSVTNIGDYTFYDCSSLTSITLSNGITSIGNYTFYDCSSLTSITIPNSVTSIGSSAFNNCSSLTSIVIPNSVETIATAAFANCTDLTSVTIGSGVQKIGNGSGLAAFAYCTNLTSVHINDIAAWCRIDFTRSGDNPLYYAHRLYLNNQEITNLVIPEGVTEIKSFTFDQCTSITSLALPNSISTIGNGFWECTNLETIYSSSSTPPTISVYTFSNISSDAVVYVPNQYVKTYKKAQQWKNMNIQEAYSVKDVESSATSASVELIHKGWTLANKYIASVGIDGGESFAGNTLEYIGLEPNSTYNDIPVVLTSNTGETETINVSFTTTELALTTQQPKAVSSNTAILLAATNMADIETSCGFEWKRNDAPADMEGTKVLCPVANGTMAGRLKNLNENVYYKYRAFYQSAAGNMYYGDWQYIFTGDATVEFDPVLYTYAPTAVTETSATLKGYAFAGSDDFTEQGFEYWSESRVNASSAPFRKPAALGEHHTVTASGISMRVTLSDLDAGTVYRYRSYAKIGSQIVYGSEMTFATQGTYVPPTYIITFVNWDGTELLTLPEVEEGTLPVYTGETPVRPDDEEFTYTFSGWSPTIVEATSDATYTATFSSQRKEEAIDQITNDQSLITNKIMKDGQILILRGDRVYTVTGQLVK